MKTARRLAQTQEYYFSRKLREVAQRIEAGQPIINCVYSPKILNSEAIIETSCLALS